MIRAVMTEWNSIDTNQFDDLAHTILKYSLSSINITCPLPTFTWDTDCRIHQRGRLWQQLSYSG